MPNFRAIFLILATFNRRPIFVDWVGHINYLHYNPVKHGLVDCPHQLKFLSFRRFVRDGFDGEDWGCKCVRKETAVDFEEDELVVGE